MGEPRQPLPTCDHGLIIGLMVCPECQPEEYARHAAAAEEMRAANAARPSCTACFPVPCGPSSRPECRNREPDPVEEIARHLALQVNPLIELPWTTRYARRLATLVDQRGWAAVLRQYAEARRILTELHAGLAAAMLAVQTETLGRVVDQASKVSEAHRRAAAVEPAEIVHGLNELLNQPSEKDGE